MLILTIRTDKPEAELGLFDDEKKLSEIVWMAHRQLAETIHLKIKEILSGQSQEMEAIEGVVVYAGPGSFTGLRIGVTVANALAAGLEVPIVGATSGAWQQLGIAELSSGQNTGQVVPDYGADAHITAPKH